MSNPFDQFDSAAPARAANPFDKFDAVDAAPKADAGGPADMLGQMRRALTKAFSGGLHTAADFVDQTTQKPVENIITALAGKSNPLAVALQDPLGAQHVADQALDVNKHVAADMAESTARAGAIPTMRDVIHNPVASLERGAGAIGNRGAAGLPLMAAAVALRDPALAAGLFGADAGAETYTDLRGQGIDRLHAGIGGLGSAGASAAGAEVGIPGIKGDGFLKAILSAATQGGVTSLGESQAHDMATGQETPVAEQIKAALGSAGLNALIGTGAHLAHAPFRATDPVAAEPVPPEPGRPWPSTPAAPAPEASAPSPEPAQPAPSPQDAGRLIAALTGTTPPVSSVAPLRDATVTVAPGQPRIDARPAEAAPEPVKLPDGHPAPEPDVVPDAAKEDLKANDGMATRVVQTTVGAKTGKPGFVRELIFRPTHDDLRTWIAANGGITPDAAENLGIDPKASRPLRPGVRNAKMIAAADSPDGMDMDTVRERMQADGWLPPDDPSRPSETDPRNLVFDAIHRGERIEHPLSTRAEREHMASEADAQAQDEALAARNGGSVPEMYARGERADARLAGDTSPEYDDIQHPEGHAPIDGQIRVLRAKREAGQLDEAGAHHLIDLMEQDARTARLAGGMPLDGVGNMRAEAEAPEPPHKAFVDLDNFKGINDEIGHNAGDQVIGQVAALLADNFPGRTFHRGGDEFVIHGASPEELHAGLQAAREEMASTPMHFIAADGRSVTLNGVGMSYGVGEHVDAAETALHADKQSRLEAGLRTERRAPGADSGGHARRAGEHPENPDAATAGGVRPGAEGDAAGARADAHGAEASRGAPAQAGVAEAARSAETGAASQVGAGQEDLAPQPAATGEPAPKPASDTPKPAEPPAPVQGDLAGGDEMLPDGATGIRKSIVNAEREAKGKDALETSQKLTDETAHAEAGRILADNPDAGRDLTHSILAEPRAVSKVEKFVLARERQRIETELRAAAQDIADAIDRGDEAAETAARMRQMAADQESELNDLASAATGSESGRSLQAQGAIVNADYSLGHMLNRAKAAFGKMDDALRKQVSEMADRIRALEAMVASKDAPTGRRRAVKMADKVHALTEAEKIAERIKRRTRENPRDHCEV